MSRTRPTFVTCLGLALAQGALVLCAFLLAVVMPSLAHQVDTPAVNPASGSDLMDIRPDAPGSAPALMAENDCWGGDVAMPADMEGVFPSRAVVTPDEGDVHVTSDPATVSLALDVALGGADAPFEVHGFCR